MACVCLWRRLIRIVSASAAPPNAGGIPDKEAAARSILHDWNTGRIPFYVLPPDAGHATSGGAFEDAEMVETVPAAAGSAARRSIVSRDESDVGAAAIVRGWSKVCRFSRSMGGVRPARFKSAGGRIPRHLALAARYNDPLFVKGGGSMLSLSCRLF
jgi:hypothetical protein